MLLGQSIERTGPVSASLVSVGWPFVSQAKLFLSNNNNLFISMGKFVCLPHPDLYGTYPNESKPRIAVKGSHLQGPCACNFCQCPASTGQLPITGAEV